MSDDSSDQDAVMAASWERFAVMRRISTTDELSEWIFNNSEVFYENGREHGLHLGLPIPVEPTWTFKNVRFQAVSTTINEDRKECSIQMVFGIHGSDPHWTIRRMFNGSGFDVRNMTEGWHDYRVSLILPPDNWASLFVRRVLERDDD